MKKGLLQNMEQGNSGHSSANSHLPPPYNLAPPPAYSSSKSSTMQQRSQPSQNPMVEQQEIKLWDSSKERRMYEDMSDLYAIIKTMEHLETAYVRDAITPEQYTEACTKLISQFKTAETGLRTAHYVTNVDAFIATYRLDCPRAVERLLRIGVPATVVYNTSNNRKDSVNVAQTVQHFITVMDSLKLNVRAVDEIQPLLSELMSSVTQVAGLPPTFDGRVKLENWLRIMNSMRASDEIDDNQARELSFELEKAYTSFMSFLNNK